MPSPIYVPGFGNPNAKILICAEAPGEEEVKQGKPLVGPTGKIAREFQDRTGIPFDSTWRTNVYKYRPPENKLQRFSELGIDPDKCVAELWDEIKKIRPNVILGLGNLALNTLTGKRGILNYRGSILKSQNYDTAAGRFYKVINTIHPAWLFKKGEGSSKYSARTFIQADFNRAAEESKTEGLDVPERRIEIADSSYKVFQYLDLHRDKNEVAIDIETINGIPCCIALAFTPYHGISIPLLDLHGILLGEGLPKMELRQIWRYLDRLFAKPNLRIIGQNFKFDHQKLERPAGFSVPDPYFDTMIAAHCIYPELPKSLAFLTSIYTKEPFYKIDGKEFNPKKDNPKQWFTYNAKDALVTMEIYRKQLVELEDCDQTDFFFNHLMPMHRIYMELEDVGFLADPIRRKELNEKYEGWHVRCQTELNELAGFEVNVNSQKDVKLLLWQELGLPFRPNTKDETLTMLLANHTKDDKRAARCIQLVLEDRRVKKARSTYIGSKPDYDGRYRSSYQIVGTKLGRTSSHKLKKPIRPGKVALGLGFQNITKHGDIGTDVREMLTIDEGYELIEADYSQAEARIVAHLCDDKVTLEIFDKSDIHKYTANMITGIDFKLITEEIRYLGKTIRYAGQYGMRKKKGCETIMKGARRFHIDIHVTEARTNELLRTFHNKTPSIHGVFHAGIQRILRDNKRVVRNGFGRRMWFLEEWGDDLFRDAYPGIPSSSVSDAIKRTMSGVRRRKRIPIVSENHDALIFVGKIDERKENLEIIKEVMEQPIPFERASISRNDLIIPVEFKIGTNYGKLEKVKF